MQSKETRTGTGFTGQFNAVITYLRTYITKKFVGIGRYNRIIQVKIEKYTEEMVIGDAE